MNKAIIIGIIAIIIGIGALAISQSNTEENVGIVEESPVIGNTENEPKQFTVGLNERVGITESP